MSRAEELERQAIEVTSKNGSKQRLLVYSLLGVLALAMTVLAAAAGITLYEIHSCVTPGWPCSDRSAQSTAEIVVSLNEGHVEIAGDLDDIKQMLREIKRMETP